MIQSNYFIHNQMLIETDHAKYLGVHIDRKLQWKEQYTQLRKKSCGLLALLKRNLAQCPRQVKEKCYKAIVRPVLEYGGCVWDPHHQSHIQSLERIQNNAARFVTNNYDYTSGNTKHIMSQLKWKPLYEQRAKKKVTLLYKAIEGQYTKSPLTI